MKPVGTGSVLLLLMPGMHLLSLGWGPALLEDLVCRPAGASQGLSADPEAWVEQLRQRLEGLRPGLGDLRLRMRQPPGDGS